MDDGDPMIFNDDVVHSECGVVTISHTLSGSRQSVSPSAEGLPIFLTFAFSSTQFTFASSQTRIEWRKKRSSHLANSHLNWNISIRALHAFAQKPTITFHFRQVGATVNI